MSRAAVLTLPNIVSLSRVALVPFFVAYPAPRARIAILGVAALTDVLDGWIARRRRAASRLGAIVDPVADRLFVLGAVAVLALEHALSIGQLAVLLSRDVMTTVGFVVARAVRWLRPVELKARLAGKATTVLQLSALLAAITWRAALAPLLVAVGIASLLAVADYTRTLWRARAR